MFRRSRAAFEGETPAMPRREPGSQRRGRGHLAVCVLLLLLTGMLWGGSALASGPRWVTGSPYFTTVGHPVVWYTNSPLYFTDPGDLSASVDHAAADALVAAAAGVWNVPTSRLVLAQGGELAEHVSGANVYLGPDGPVFPADVSSANYAAIQIAVIYDSDGSVTELLLGQGASDPAECAQNGVTESVDAIVPTGQIQHALLILNGRCSGPNAEQQMQLQYQLMRAFGRVLGLGWSQTNDNVFTGTPQATSEEINKWPIMHPIDIVCGPYTYQCLPNPFTLRPDDVASISQLYLIARGTATAGKVDTLSNASAITGRLLFADGQGMQGVNLVLRRLFPATTFADIGPVVSTVTGTEFLWSRGNPVTGPAAETVAGSMGSGNPSLEGVFSFGMIPELANTELQDAVITAEAINPLYIGGYGIGPYVDAPVTPSGSAFTLQDNGIVPYESNFYILDAPGTATSCSTAGLGSQASPVAFPATGWSTGSLCEYGVSAWSEVTVQANRSLTVEATALDEQGLVTENKLQPLIGVWSLPNPEGGLPTVAAAVSPFNSIAAGLTSLNFDTPLSSGQTGPLEIVVTDERGDGRPDYNFRARVLYADSILPANVAAGGGLVTIAGMGFRPGNQVTVGGVAATVLSSTATTILALAPPFATIETALGPGTALAADVCVEDAMSGGESCMYGALTYPASALPGPTEALTMLTPVFYVAAGQRVGFMPQVSVSAAGAFAPGIAVAWSAVGAGLSFPGASQSTSDGNGLASIAVTAGPLASAATATGSACAWTAVCAGFSAIGVDPSLWTPIAIEGGTQSVASGSVLQPMVFQITDGAGDPVIGAPVAVYQTVASWVVCPSEGRCPTPETYQTGQSSAVSDGNGLVTVTPLQLAGTPEVTTVAVAAGTRGFVSVALQKTP